MTRLVLASASPRRRELLAKLGLLPEIRPVNLDETPAPGEDARRYVERLAREKAAAAAGEGAEILLAADTAVVLDGEILGKPADPEEARTMLRRLSGRAHEVLTGVALLETPKGAAVSAIEETRVVFRTLDEEEIAAYVATGEARDKAGAYGIQGRAAVFVPRIEGSWSNVVGLPLELVDRLLRRLGRSWDELREPAG